MYHHVLTGLNFRKLCLILVHTGQFGEWLTMATRNTHILNICTLSLTYLTFSWLF